MNRLFFFLLIPLLAFVMSSCSKTEFVVLRSVPPNPSFQVVPTYLDPNEIAYTNNIERALIGSGVKVLIRPAHKEVTTERILPEDKSRKEPYETRKIEYTFEYDKLTADYLVQTYYNPRQIKISKVSTREILAVFTILDSTQYHNSHYRRIVIFDALVKLGILNQ